MMNHRTVSFHTLGCKLNFSETSTIARQFSDGGFRRAQRGEKADICIINTCSVTEHADKKCRNLIRRLTRQNLDAIIAVTGCYAQLRADAIAAIEGVDIVVGNSAKDEIYPRILALTAKGKGGIYGCGADSLTGFFSSFSTGDRTRAFLKVQDGCSYKCSYCTIPAARGESRNISIEEILVQAREIVGSGIKEIVLTGINTGDFGRTTGEKFIDLLRRLENVEGIERYRISSIEPNLLTDEIIGFTAASGKFQPHFHIPLQSGCDSVLKDMRRRYTTATFEERINAVRNIIPEAFIGIDVIVGFPGETDEKFEETYSFLEKIRPSFLHVFPFSVRPGTPAADFPDRVAPHTASARVKKLTELSDKLHNEFAERFIGRTAEVLFESSVKNGMMSGYTENYVKVSTPYVKDRINRICRVVLGPTLPGGELSCIISE